MARKIISLVFVLSILGFSARAEDLSPRAVVEKCLGHLRGKASVSTVAMTVHRPDWERKMTIKCRTKGIKESIFFITAPPKDNGNGTLKKGRDMWMYNPKVNRVIKLPPSMMSQSWQGSDFSNNDLSKTDSIIEDYNHEIMEEGSHDDKKVYKIKSMPKPDAPVVWGMLQFKIREDGVLLSQEYFDEDLLSVKKMVTGKVEMMGGRPFPSVWKMQKADAKDEYTLLEYKSIEFLDTLPSRHFTVSALKKPIR